MECGTTALLYASGVLLAYHSGQSFWERIRIRIRLHLLSSPHVQGFHSGYIEGTAGHCRAPEPVSQALAGRFRNKQI